MNTPTKVFLFSQQLFEFRSTHHGFVRFLMGIRSLQLVILTQRVHPFPFRTRKLSSVVATILVWRRTGKIAHRQHLVGVFNAEGPPVPIPNTEVKLCCGNNTCLETSREDSSLPTQQRKGYFGIPFQVAISSNNSIRECIYLSEN